MYAFSVIAMNVIVLATPSSKRLAAGAVSSFFCYRRQENDRIEKGSTKAQAQRLARRNKQTELRTLRSFGLCAPRREVWGTNIF